MNRKSNVEHSSISKIDKAVKSMPDGVVNALNKVKELNESEVAEETIKESIPEVRQLVLFGKIVEDFTIGDYRFKISTLSNRQQKSLVKRLMKLDSEERIADIKVVTLTEAVVSINELPLENYFSYSPSGDNKFTIDEIRYEVISELQSGLVSRLFDFYESLVVKSNKIFSDGSLNSEIKN
jgi:hypothetical protein